jgi:hypothetical protein
MYWKEGCDMAYLSEDDRRFVFEQEGGRCHFCGRALEVRDYGRKDVVTGWFIDSGNMTAKRGFPAGDGHHATCFYCGDGRGEVLAADYGWYAGRNR